MVRTHVSSMNGLIPGQAENSHLLGRKCTDPAQEELQK